MAESKRTGKKLEVVRDDDLPFLGAFGAWTRRHNGDDSRLLRRHCPYPYLINKASACLIWKSIISETTGQR